MYGNLEVSMEGNIKIIIVTKPECSKRERLLEPVHWKATLGS